MDREAWQATLHKVTKNQTQLKQPSMCIIIYLQMLSHLCILGKSHLIMMHDSFNILLNLVC